MINSIVDPADGQQVVLRKALTDNLVHLHWRERKKNGIMIPPEDVTSTNRQR